MIKMSMVEKIDNILNIKNTNLFVVSFKNKMKIYDIKNANEKLIQTIINKTYCFLTFNQNIFISYNLNYISLYYNIKGSKIYQLSSKLKLVGSKSITKLNKKILLVLLDNKKLYKIDIINMNIEQIDLPFITEKEEEEELEFKLPKIVFDFQKKNSFIYNNKGNIYIYIEDILYYIKYINNKFEFIESFNFSPLKAVNYLSNKYIKLSNIIINCINILLDFDEYNGYINNYINYIIFYRPKIKSNSKKDLIIKSLLEPTTNKRKSNKKMNFNNKMKNKYIENIKKEKSIKKIFINNKKEKKNIFKRNFNLYSKQKVSHPNSFKKNYR